MGCIRTLTRTVLFLVIQGMKGTAQDLKNVDYDISDPNWDIHSNFCRLPAHNSKGMHLVTSILSFQW